MSTLPCVVRAGDLLFVECLAAIDHDGAPLAPGDAAAQASAVFGAIDTALRREGCSLDDVVQTRMLLTADGDPAIEVRGAVFAASEPASLGLGLRTLGVDGAAFASGAVAVVPGDRRRATDDSGFGRLASYSRAIASRGYVFATGTTAAREGMITPSGARPQAELVLDKLGSAITDVGASWSDVTHIRAYVTDPADFPDVADVIGHRLAEQCAAVTGACVAEFGPPELRVKIEAEAIVGGERLIARCRPGNWCVSGCVGAVRIGGHVMVSGIDDAGGSDPLEHARGVLAEVGAALGEVVQIHVYALEEHAALARSVVARFGRRVAATVLRVGALPHPDACVQIDLHAFGDAN